MVECGPMVFYIVLVVVQILIGISTGKYYEYRWNNVSASNVATLNIPTIVTILTSWALCAFILHLLCSSGHKTFAWIIVLFPVIFGIIEHLIISTNPSSTNRPSTGRPSTVRPSTVRPTTRQPNLTGVPTPTRSSRKLQKKY